MAEDRKLYRAYVDETGDRGTKAKSSPFFAFAALVLRDEYDAKLRATLDDVAQKCRREPGGKLHWSDLTHLQRRYATECLAQLPFRTIYVMVPKATIPPASRVASDHGAFYNFAARIVVERISWLVNESNGVAKLTFERVKGYPERILIDYLDLLRSRHPDPTIKINWEAIHETVRVDSPANVRGLCAADMLAGALDSAVRPDPHTGLLEPTYLFNLAPTVMKFGFGGSKAHLRHGLKALAPSPNADAPFTSLPWWPGPFV